MEYESQQSSEVEALKGTQTFLANYFDHRNAHIFGKLSLLTTMPRPKRPRRGKYAIFEHPASLNIRSTISFFTCQSVNAVVEFTIRVHPVEESLKGSVAVTLHFKLARVIP
jgi:hypothetical protein